MNGKTLMRYGTDSSVPSGKIKADVGLDPGVVSPDEDWKFLSRRIELISSSSDLSDP